MSCTEPASGRPGPSSTHIPTPKRTVNPVAAALLANQLIGEPITGNLAAGMLAVLAGIWIAVTEGRASPSG